MQVRFVCRHVPPGRYSLSNTEFIALNVQTLNAFTSPACQAVQNTSTGLSWCCTRRPDYLTREVALLEKIVRGTGWGQLQASADGVAYQLTLSRA